MTCAPLASSRSRVTVARRAEPDRQKQGRNGGIEVHSAGNYRAHMKITCQSCQSKYNVADEKVQGKIVKIRCRKCGATIVVDGTAAPSANGASSPPAAAPAPAPASAPSAESQDANPWHVNVAENDQRTMTLPELVDAYNTGVVTQDTFIWTEGMEDWKALGEVDVVVSALHESAAAAAAQQGVGVGARAVSPPTEASNGFAHEAAALPRMTTEESTDASTRVYEPAGAAAAFSSFEPAVEAPAPAAPVAAAPASSPRAEARRAAVARRENRGRDLFASRAEEGPGAFDVQTSAPSLSRPPPAIDDPSKRTGERNENSVLFSLAVLTQNADQRAPTADSGASDDSGLIDLKALAAKTESMRPSAGSADASVFSAPFGGMQQLSAPIGAIDAPLGEAQGKSRTPLYVVLAIAGVLLVGGGGMILGARVMGAGPAPMPSASALAMPSATASASAEPEPSATASATASAASTASSAPVAVKPRPVPMGGGASPRPAAAAARPAGASPGGDSTPAAAPAPAPKKGDCGCNGDLMCLMKCSTH
jgi:predicted Zn finger-like uncharacterized protein